ncbi:MAG: LysR family transcriptional regulator [Burkholderiales bacterium]|nr:LysR family transcriptional regulator [Burkholderiales bacterium]MBH2016994.1 LysR family transcriptional regulator [Burkholderiales bacterium]
MNGIDVRHADFRRIDLNLLVALDALLSERQVSRAAERLFIGQPAMSHALARLRELFGDELLVRTGRQMALTDLATHLAPRVRAWLTEGAALVLKEPPFEPAQAQGLVRMSIPDGLEALILPPLLARLRAESPGIRLRVQLIEVDRLLDALDADEVDIVVVGVPVPQRNWHERSTLLTATLQCVHSRLHPSLSGLNQGPLTLHKLAKLDHVVSSYRGEAVTVVDAAFAAEGLQRNVVAAVAGVGSTVRILRSAPLVSIQVVLDGVMALPDDLVVTPVKTREPLRMAVDMLWHRRHGQQGLHRHVRECIREIAAPLTDVAGGA